MTSKNLTFNITAAAAYVGPGDITNNAHSAWWGCRAYSAASRGQALFHVCKNTPIPATVTVGTGDGVTTTFSYTATSLPIKIGSVVFTATIGGASYGSFDQFSGVTRASSTASITGNGTIDYTAGAMSITYSVAPDAGKPVTLAFSSIPDQGEADVWSDPVTGDLVPVVIGGVTCPDALGSFTIKTCWDLTAHGNRIDQPVINKRPILMLRAVPVLGTENRCGIWFPDASLNGPIPTMVSGSGIVANWGTLPLTMSAFAINQNPTPNRRGNTSTSSTILRPSSGSPLIFFQQQFTDNTSHDRFGMNAGSTGWAPSLVGGAFAYQQISPQPYVLDHEPHAIQAMFSANGTTSSAFVDGFLYPNLTTGTTFPTVPTTIELGASDIGDHFNGVIFEAGFALGDQSAHNAAMDANQRAYYLTPTQSHTPVVDWTADFNNQAPGTRVTWDVQTAIFNNSNLGIAQNSNYVLTSDMTTAAADYRGPTDGRAASPAPTQLFRIVRDGPDSTPTVSDPAIEIMYPVGEYGYPMPGIGHPDMSWFPNGAAYDVMQVEYDLMFRDSTTAPNGLDFNWYHMGKPGIFLGVNEGGNATAHQNMWYTVVDSNNAPIKDVGGRNFAYSYVDTGGEGGIDGSADSIGFGGAMGVMHLAVWYHRKVVIALGPNGYLQFWSDDGRGTPLKLRHALSRHDPYRWSPVLHQWIGALSAPNGRAAYPGTQLALGGHFGGGVADKVLNNSYLVYDNIHYTAWKR